MEFVSFRLIFFTLPPVGVRSIVISVSVCVSLSLFVCLYARVSQKLHVRISPHFLYLLPVAVARCSSDVSAMMSCFHMIERMGRIGDDVYVSSSSPDGGTGPMSADSD